MITSQGQKRFMDVVKEDMWWVGVTEEDTVAVETRQKNFSVTVFIILVL